MFYIYCAPEGKNYASDLPQPTFMVREGQNEIAEPVCEDMTFLYEASSDNTYQILTTPPPNSHIATTKHPHYTHLSAG